MLENILTWNGLRRVLVASRSTTESGGMTGIYAFSPAFVDSCSCKESRPLKLTARLHGSVALLKHAYSHCESCGFLDQKTPAVGDTELAVASSVWSCLLHLFTFAVNNASLTTAPPPSLPAASSLMNIGSLLSAHRFEL